jgi:hypothetical protein
MSGYFLPFSFVKLAKKIIDMFIHIHIQMILNAPSRDKCVKINNFIKKFCTLLVNSASALLKDKILKITVVMTVYVKLL